MKKMKRLFAVLLTLAMVLGMSVVTFAAPTEGKTYVAIEIPVTNAGDKATYQHLQLIQPNETEKTGWEFVNEAIQGNFTAALGNVDAQTAIWMLIKKETPDNTNIPENITAATDDQVKAAITNVANAGYALVDGNSVNSAGVYYVRVTEPGYAYNPMAAYVSFKYNEGGAPTELETAGIEAKRSEIKTEKSSQEKDKIAEIGRIETYYVKTTVPFVPMQDANRHYIVKDEISGAKYELTANKVQLKVYIGAEKVNAIETAIKNGTLNDSEGTLSVEVDKTFQSNEVTGNSFSADLTDLLNENTYANTPIIITYQAEVTDVHVGNDVKIGNGANDGENIYGSDHEDLWTGKITIKKVDEADTNVVLKGAGFIISKGDESNTKYAKFDENNKFVEWVDKLDDSLQVFTGEEGLLTVEGLDQGTYHITERTAPEGYSIRDNIDDVTIGKDINEATEVFTTENDVEVKDTKLSSLPSTGGIGTTIFTIAGCLIMIAAAGLFFATRRKSAK